MAKKIKFSKVNISVYASVNMLPSKGYAINFLSEIIYHTTSLSFWEFFWTDVGSYLLPNGMHSLCRILLVLFSLFPKEFWVSSGHQAAKFDNLQKKRKTLNSSHNGTEIKVQTAEQQTLGFSLNTSICK